MDILSSKKKVKLSLSQEAKWQDYFFEVSKKAIEIKNTININDKTIFSMGCELYGLGEDEIAIVENN